MQLHVSPNNRFLMRADGTPFFWLADTAWQLFNDLSREDTELYLQTRARQGFTAVQAVALAELRGFDGNFYGDAPLHNFDPTQPNEAYFAHVDWVVRRAGELGLTVGFLPTWGDKWNAKWGAGPEIFTPGNAREYGRFLGERYATADIVWVLGGDRPVENETHREITRAMSRGIQEGEATAKCGHHLQTWHPKGGETSAQYFHGDEWLDFNMWQTGHGRDRDCYRRIAQSYALEPARPVIDGEPGYENHPNEFRVENGYLGAWDVRKFLWWDVFAGACGHTYGCHDIWQMWDGVRTPKTFARTPWREALNLEGATQMACARKLLEARPFFSRVPDDSLLLSPQPDSPSAHIGATRDADGGYALVYSAAGMGFTLATSKLAGTTLRASWFDPRTGNCQTFEEFERQASREFAPPTSGENCDWVFVVEDIARDFAPL